jgi:5-methylcytosine-specific restriction protein A
MLVVIFVTWVVSRWDARAAYRLLETSQELFEPDEALRNQSTPPPRNQTARNQARRPYISPLVKKRIAAKQGWRCAVCKRLLDETYEIDHIKTLCRGGSNDLSNLQALCKRCHAWKSAVVDQRS